MTTETIILEQPPRRDESYIGDGVYVSHDGYHIWLRTERQEGWHEIALEPPVYEALLTYVNRLKGARP